jgi:acyl-CoA thioesterase I
MLSLRLMSGLGESSKMMRCVVGAQAKAMGWLLVTTTIVQPSGSALAQEKLSAALSSVMAMANVIPTTPPQLSSDCRSQLVAGDKYRRPLRGLRRAVREARNPRVLAIGSSSTVGVGASQATNTYVAKLEVDLEQAFKGVDFDVFGSGIGGEIAEGQSARMKQTVDEIRPDLVLWQVGTNDALRHVDINAFKNCLRRTLAWLADNKFDVMMVDPQYSDKLVKDAFYEEVVAAIGEVAAEHKVLLVDRFEAMRQLSRERGDAFYLASDQLHLNDAGHRCMAEQLARAIVAGVLQADFDTSSTDGKLNIPGNN